MRVRELFFPWKRKRSLELVFYNLHKHAQKKDSHNEITPLAFRYLSLRSIDLVRQACPKLNVGPQEPKFKIGKMSGATSDFSGLHPLRGTIVIPTNNIVIACTWKETAGFLL